MNSPLLETMLSNLLNTVPRSQAPKNLGFRTDGTPKGTGWLGTFRVPGGVASEFTIPMWERGDPGQPGYSKGPDVPVFVPGLTSNEVYTMIHDVIPNKKRIPKGIVDKALLHAQRRMDMGASPFFQEPR